MAILCLFTKAKRTDSTWSIKFSLQLLLNLPSKLSTASHRCRLFDILRGLQVQIYSRSINKELGAHESTRTSRCNWSSGPD